MSKIRVGVVRGGPSSEYDISLQTGENVLRNLDTEKYAPLDILLTTSGDWYAKGVRTDLDTLSRHVDVIWNALHGSFGEDGRVQKLFESFGIPYTGSGVLPSGLGMHKGLAKERFNEAGLLTPQGEVIEPDTDMGRTTLSGYRHGIYPLVVKPVSGGSSLATFIVNSYGDLERAVARAGVYGDVLIEEYIDGREATVAVIDGANGSDVYALHPIEIVPPEDKRFFDFDAKYSGVSQEICPGRFTPPVSAELQQLAARAHRALGARHYSRSDFIVAPSGMIYLLEINTLPGLTKESLVPKALKASGLELPEFFDHVIDLALKN